MDYQSMYDKIQKKLIELKAEAVADCKIDKTDLFHSFNTVLLIKWINKRLEWSKLARTYNTERQEKFRTLYEYYRTEFDVKLSTKDEYSLYIESDSNYVMINNLYLTTKEIVQYTESVIDTLKGRQYEIKNIIEYQKFMNGQ